MTSFNTNVEHDAFAFAMAKHHGQERKYTGEQYIIHPIRVADLVRSVEHTPAMAAAALLHDVLEDTDTKIYELRERFGNEITDLVVELTDVYNHTEIHGNRARRKALECARLATVSPAAQTIKVADIIDNHRSIIQHDPDFAKVWINEKCELLADLTKANFELWNIAAFKI